MNYRRIPDSNAAKVCNPVNGPVDAKMSQLRKGYSHEHTRDHPPGSSIGPYV
jgi:hypothetical protein